MASEKRGFFSALRNLFGGRKADYNRVQTEETQQVPQSQSQSAEPVKKGFFGNIAQSFKSIFSSKKAEMATNIQAEPLLANENIRNEKMETVTIDFAKIREQVSYGNDAPNLYNSLDYLNANISMPAFKEVRNSLQNDTATPESLKQSQGELFKILKDFAVRSAASDDYGVNKAYKNYDALVKSKGEDSEETIKAKRDFVQTCAVIKRGGRGDEIWDHNQGSPLAAKLLLNIMDEKDPKEIKTQLENDLNKVHKINEKQTHKDIVTRGNAVFDNNGEVISMRVAGEDKFYAKLAEVDPQTGKPNLTGEQVGFIKTLWNQGNFEGGPYVSIAPSANSSDFLISGGSVLRDETPSNCFIRKEMVDGQERTYVMASKQLILEGGDEPVKQGSYTTIADITDLKGESFTIGCASAEVPVRCVIEAKEKSIMPKLDIPPEFCSKQTEKLDQKIFTDAQKSIAEAQTQKDNSRASKAESISLPSSVDHCDKSKVEAPRTPSSGRSSSAGLTV